MKGRTHRVSVEYGNYVVYSSKDFSKIQEGKYKNGKKEGEWITYHPGGVLSAVITHYKKGELSGKMKTYSFKGHQLKSVMNYKKGVLDGKTTIYDKDGKVSKVINYKNGSQVKEGMSFTPEK